MAKICDLAAETLTPDPSRKSDRQTGSALLGRITSQIAILSFVKSSRILYKLHLLLLLNKLHLLLLLNYF